MWNDRDSTHAAAFGWGPVRENIVESVWLSCCALARDHTGCRENKHAVQRAFISTQRNSLLTHDAQGRRCDGTPPFSKTRLWICRRRCRACCEREGRAAAADIDGTRPRGHRAAKVPSPRSPRKTTSIISSPKKCAGDTGVVITAAGTVAITGLAQASLGLASTPALWLAAGVIGVGIAAAGITAAAIGVAGTGKAVPRLGARRPTWPERPASVR